MKINKYGNATEEMLRSFEKQIGFSLPKDYRDFLHKFNGGTPEVKYSTFWVNDLVQRIPLHVLFGLEVDKLDLRKRYETFCNDMLENSIIIGNDPGANFIVLINDNENNGVYYWDHTMQFSESSEECNMYFVSDDFSKFIQTLEPPTNE